MKLKHRIVDALDAFFLDFLPAVLPNVTVLALVFLMFFAMARCNYYRKDGSVFDPQHPEIPSASSRYLYQATMGNPCQPAAGAFGLGGRYGGAAVLSIRDEIPFCRVPGEIALCACTTERGEEFGACAYVCAPDPNRRADDGAAEGARP